MTIAAVRAPAHRKFGAADEQHTTRGRTLAQPRGPEAVRTTPTYLVVQSHPPQRRKAPRDVHPHAPARIAAVDRKARRSGATYTSEYCHHAHDVPRGSYSRELGHDLACAAEYGGQCLERCRLLHLRAGVISYSRLRHTKCHAPVSR